MFPFSINNPYLNTPFQYNMNYQYFRQPFPAMGPYFNPYPFQNFNTQHEGNFLDFSKPNEPLMLPQKIQSNVKQQNVYLHKKKRITKKLKFCQMKKQLRNLSKQSKSKKKSFKYYDPSRAPPISSLRNPQQLQMDLKEHQQKINKYLSKSENSQKRFDRDVMKLQILMKQPSQKQYPFLICKKRKYYRNLKRRYSVAFFQQRAYYINKKLPIPPELYPKNKVRKARSSNKNGLQNENNSYSSSQSVSQSYDSEVNMQNCPARSNAEQKLQQQYYDEKCLKVTKQVKQQISFSQKSNQSLK